MALYQIKWNWGVGMNGSECPSWCFEFWSTANPFIWGLDKNYWFWGNVGIFSCENFQVSTSEGVKPCHKIVNGCSMRKLLKCFDSSKP
jgi:hypothetical protein